MSEFPPINEDNLDQLEDLPSIKSQRPSFVEPKRIYKTVDISNIYPFLQRKEITIFCDEEDNPLDNITSTLYKIFTDADGERKREIIKDIELPIGSTMEYIKALLSPGKYLLVLKDEEGKFLTSKMIEIEGEVQPLIKEKEEYIMSNDSFVNELKSKVDKLQNEKDMLIREKYDAEQKYGKLELELSMVKKQYENERQATERQLLELNSKIEIKEEKIKELKENEKIIEKLKEDLLEAKNTIRDLQSEIKMKDLEVSRLEKEINEIKSVNNRLESEIINLRNMKEMLTIVRSKDDNKLLLPLLEHLTRSSAEKIKCSTELEKAKLEADKELALARISAQLDNIEESNIEDIESIDNIEGEPKTDDIITRLVKSFGDNFIAPITKVLNQAGYTISKQEDIEKIIKEREELARVEERKKINQALTLKHSGKKQSKSQQKEVKDEE